MSDRVRKPPAESTDRTEPSGPPEPSVAEKPGPSALAIPSTGERVVHVTPTDRAAGEIIAKRYRLDEELGHGGMGVVWAATHMVTRRRVAMKFLRGPTDLRTDLRRRFLREARAAGAIDHPNVVAVTDVFELEDETPVIVMELLVGETLRDRLVRVQRLPLGQAACVLVQVIAAVGTGHALGIVHRDLKPENIFLARAAAGEIVKVLDFGIAKLLAGDADDAGTDSLTGTGSMLGTPSYMAPEQTLGEKIDQRADIWALGVILYECLAGVRPLRGSGIGQVVLALATEGVQPLDRMLPDLPQEVTAIVMRMLSRERRDRPQDLLEVSEVLSRFAVEATPPFPVTAVSRGAPSGERARREAGQTPAVDTEAPQAMPRGSRRPLPRSLFVAIASGGVLLTAFFGWSLRAPVPARPLAGPGAPPSTGTAASWPAESATAIRTAAASVVAPSGDSLADRPPAPSVAPPSDASAPRTARPAAQGASRANASASTAPLATAAPSGSVSESPSAKLPTGGLAEKPPF
jgi:eukaryotic-like serine/threonine-protein kinase